MDRVITATEANQRFSEVLRDVASGESFTVTSRGRPVARVTPAQSSREQRMTRQKEVLDFFKRQRPVTTIRPWKREDLYD